MSLSDVIKTALDQMQSIAKTETVVGEPITAGGVTLIPVSRVSIGFAAGGAGKDDTSAAGAGTGGGITVTPVAFIEVSEGSVRVHQITPDDLCLYRILELAPGAIKKVSQFFKRSGGEKADHDDAD